MKLLWRNLWLADGSGSPLRRRCVLTDGDEVVAVEPEITASAADRTVEIDGKIKENVWKRAGVIPMRDARGSGAELVSKPQGRMLWDKNGIYLAAAISGKSDGCPSRIVSPAGKVMAETWKEQTYAAATIDLRDPPVNLPWLSVTEGDGETRTFYTHERHPTLYRDLVAPEVESAPEKP